MVLVVGVDDSPRGSVNSVVQKNNTSREGVFNTLTLVQLIIYTQTYSVITYLVCNGASFWGMFC